MRSMWLVSGFALSCRWDRQEKWLRLLVSSHDVSREEWEQSVRLVLSFAQADTPGEAVRCRTWQAPCLGHWTVKVHQLWSLRTVKAHGTGANWQGATRLHRVIHMMQDGLFREEEVRSKRWSRHTPFAVYLWIQRSTSEYTWRLVLTK